MSTQGMPAPLVREWDPTITRLWQQARRHLDHANDLGALDSEPVTLRRCANRSEDGHRLASRVTVAIEPERPEDAALHAGAHQLSGHGRACPVRTRDRVEHDLCGL